MSYECAASPDGQHDWESVTRHQDTIERQMCLYCGLDPVAAAAQTRELNDDAGPAIQVSANLSELKQNLTDARLDLERTTKVMDALATRFTQQESDDCS